MQKEVSNFDFSDFYDEGFEKTSNIRQAIYVFQDGSMWNGYSEGGGGYIRDVDYGSIEAFFKDTSIDRYHPEYHSMVLSELVQVVPETQTVLMLAANDYTEEQLKVLQQFQQEGFSIEQLENHSEVKQSTLTEEIEQAYIELEQNLMELEDEKFWGELQLKYDLTKLEDIEKAQEETEKRLMEEEKEVNEFSEIENIMWDMYEQQEKENAEEKAKQKIEQKNEQKEIEHGLSF